jgi:hypothetical protein
MAGLVCLNGICTASGSGSGGACGPNPNQIGSSCCPNGPPVNGLPTYLDSTGTAHCCDYTHNVIVDNAFCASLNCNNIFDSYQTCLVGTLCDCPPGLACVPTPCTEGGVAKCISPQLACALDDGVGSSVAVGTCGIAQQEVQNCVPADCNQRCTNFGLGAAGQPPCGQGNCVNGICRCGQGDACVGGQCKPMGGCGDSCLTVPCAEGNCVQENQFSSVCTCGDDSFCDPTKKCQPKGNCGAACAAGNQCMTGICQGGICGCPAGNTIQSCGPAMCGGGQCVGQPCPFGRNVNQCGVATACNAGVCQYNACAPGNNVNQCGPAVGCPNGICQYNVCMQGSTVNNCGAPTGCNAGICQYNSCPTLMNSTPATSSGGNLCGPPTSCNNGSCMYSYCMPANNCSIATCMGGACMQQPKCTPPYVCNGFGNCVLSSSGSSGSPPPPPPPGSSAGGCVPGSYNCGGCTTVAGCQACCTQGGITGIPCMNACQMRVMGGGV